MYVCNKNSTEVLICGTENLRNQDTVELRIPKTQSLRGCSPEFMKARTTRTKDPWNEGTTKPTIYNTA